MKTLVLIAAIFVFVGCECSKTDPKTGSGTQTLNSTSTADPSAAASADSIGAFTVTVPKSGVVGPNVRAEWTTEGHAEGTIYDYLIGKNADCSEIAYQGSDLPVNKIALSLGKGTYYLCVTAKKDGASRKAENTPYKFDVELES